MRKIYLCMVILFVCSGVQAQYRKASFINKSGRTYDLGGMGHFLGGGAGAFPGIYYSYGLDQGKKTFYWFDLEVILPTKFSYNTVQRNNTSIPVTVNYKSKVAFTYRFNYAYYLTNPENTESKFKPFVTAGANFILTSMEPMVYETKPENSDPARQSNFDGTSFGIGAGIGGIYAITENFGIKVTAGYNLQYKNKTSQYVPADGATVYHVYGSHPYVGLGIRFVIKGDGD